MGYCKNIFESLKKNKRPLFFFAIISFIHVFFFYRAIGPFNLFTDSFGYLLTSDHFFQSNEWVFNPNRPIGLPLLYLGLLKLGGYSMAWLVLVQIISLFGTLFFAVSAAIPQSLFWKKLLVTTLIIFLCTRTFVYSYFVLSESFFTSGLLVFIGFFLLYFSSLNDNDEKKRKSDGFLWGMLLSAIFISWIKSVGIIFLGLFFLVFFFNIIINKINVLSSAGMVFVLFVVISLNHSILGTYLFSKQDGIQLLISANRYINYDTEFMVHEKELIHSSHNVILAQYFPRTRLDQMIGPVPGMETPSQILLDDSENNYDVYNAKIRSLIFEGLLADGDWKWYLLDGFSELKRMILSDEKEGLILPIKTVSNSNNMISSWLEFLKESDYNFQSENTKLQSISTEYYLFFVSYGVTQKYLFSSIFLISLGCSFFLGVKFRLLFPVIIFFLFLVLYLYISVLLVFALDKYYVGIEMVLCILALTIFRLIESGKRIPVSL